MSKELCPNISVKEIVCPHVYKKFGDEASKFIDPLLIKVIDIIRNDILKQPITINNGTTLTQRGLRCNCCELVASKTKKNIVYLSGHNFGKAIDFNCSTISPDDCRKMIIKNAELFPCKIRLEDGRDATTWVHVDIMAGTNQKEKCYIFRA